jgi:hypothetical protein
MVIAVCPLQAIAGSPPTKIEFIQKSFSSSGTEKVEFPSRNIAESSQIEFTSKPVGEINTDTIQFPQLRNIGIKVSLKTIPHPTIIPLSRLYSGDWQPNFLTAPIPRQNLSLFTGSLTKVQFFSQQTGDIPPVEKDLPSHYICPLSVDLTGKTNQIIPLIQLTVDDQTITLQIQGTTVLDQATLLNDPKISEILKKNRDKQLTKVEFIPIYQEIAKSLTQIYLNQGYITSKAVPQENLEIPVDGVITIPILEGRLKEIVLIGRGRLNPNYLCDRVGLGIGIPLNIIQVEEQLRLLRQNPLLSGIDGNLKNSGTAGLSILEVTVQESQAFSASLSFDNYSPIS